MNLGNQIAETLFGYRLFLAVSTVLFCIFATTFSYAQSKEYVVFSIKGSITDLNLGQILVEGDRIVIPAGVDIKLLGKDGKILPISGPASATVTNDGDDDLGESTLSTVASKLFDGKKFVAVLGGTRSVESNTDIEELFPKAEFHEAWSPLLSQFNDYCLKMKNPTLRRDASTGPLNMVLSSGSGVEKNIAWTDQSVVLNLNEHLESGQSQLLIKVVDRPTSIVIHLMDTKDTTTGEQAAWMIDKNCHYQALHLLAKQ